MDLTPLTNAPLAVQIHAYAALGAFALGMVQLARVKGTMSHRALGFTWVALMLVMAISSFWIHTIPMLGPLGPIHLLSILSLVMLPLGVWYAHRHIVRERKLTMIGMFAGALVIAGLFTPAPGRIMSRVVFGG